MNTPLKTFRKILICPLVVLVLFGLAVGCACCANDPAAFRRARAEFERFRNA